MYLRQTTLPPKKLVKNGKAQFGSFFPVPPKIDICGVIAPFAGLPLPSVITNFRIRGHLAYTFCIENFIGFLEIFDGKVFALADITLWNKETGSKYIYKTFLTARRSFVPISTERGTFSTLSRKKKIILRWNRKTNSLVLDFDFKGDSVYPHISGYIRSTFSGGQFSEFASVTPAPVASRCSASWVVATKARASVSLGDKKGKVTENLSNISALSCLVLNRAFYKFHTTMHISCGIGKTDGKNIIFRLVNTSFDAVEADNFNENFLTVDGRQSLLPGVIITHPFGVDKKWIIQDTENMIDLTFTPISRCSKSFHLIFFNTRANTIFGTFEGTLLDKDGQKIVLKDFPGIATTKMMRI